MPSVLPPSFADRKGTGPVCSRMAHASTRRSDGEGQFQNSSRIQTQCTRELVISGERIFPVDL